MATFVPSWGPSAFCGQRIRRSLLTPIAPTRHRTRRSVPSACANATQLRNAETNAPVSVTNPHARFYEFDPDDIEAVRVRHVLLRTEALADAVYEAVRRRQTTLRELASSASICEASKNNEGDLGWFRAEHRTLDGNAQSGMNAELLRVALRTRPQTLAKVQTDAGVHVFVVEDVKHKLRTTSALPQGTLRGKVVDSAKTIPMSYAIQTLGCQMNKSDAERMAGELESMGYTPVGDPFQAAVVVLNTCSIREHAESKVYSYLGRHAKRKRSAPDDVTLCVAGCVAQQEGEKLLRRVPELDLVLGPHYSNRLSDLLWDVKTNQSQVVATEPIFIQEDMSKARRSSSVTAWVNVIYGCCERCTYCVVPHVRGLEQSRPMDAVRKEIEQLASAGYREVVLLGQNIDAYGRDMYPKRTFSDLLRCVHDVDGIERIRFTTSHPRYMSTQLIATCAALPKIMPSFHIPPQSGDNDVLRAMKRGYTVERFLNIVKRIKEHIPDASIAGDVIVGFPGETEAQFQNTLMMMDKVKFDMLNTAAYSPRPNTDAAMYENQVPENVKTDRLARINKLVEEHALQRSRRYLGRVEHVLVEDADPKRNGSVVGRNAANRIVRFPGDVESLLGKIVPVKITDATAFKIMGVQHGAPY